MKHWLTAIAMLFAAHHVKSQSIDHSKLLEAIRQVENTPRWKVGRAGEVSEYQLLPLVWARYSDYPIHMATSHAESAIVEQQRVANAHLRWLIKHVENPSPYRIAVAWNGGLSAANNSRVSKGTACYARRVVNIYETL